MNGNKRAHDAITVTRVPFGDATHPLHRVALSNGLVAYVLEDHVAPVVSFQTWYQVGSRDEKRGKTGQAHLLEHLMFNETKNNAYGQFDRRMEFAGGETNAATWCDWTYYYENVPAAELALAMELESDRMQNLVLRKKQVKSELEVVASERRDRVEDDIEGAMGEAVYAAAFGKDHPYGWPTIGRMRDIAAFSPKDCADFYANHYVPNGAVIVIAGAVKQQTAVELLTRFYAKIPSGPKKTRSVVPVVKNPRTRNVRFGWETDTERAVMGFLVPGYATPEHAVLFVLQQLLTGGRSARLYQLMIRNEEVVSDVRASIAPFEAASIFEISFSLRDKKKLPQAEKLIWSTLAAVAAGGITEEELECAKARLELGFLGGLETASGRAEQIGFSVTVTGDPSFGWKRLAQYRKVSRGDLAVVAQRYLNEKQVVRVVATPSRKKHRARKTQKRAA